jgi:hypothetical protein
VQDLVGATVPNPEDAELPHQLGLGELGLIEGQPLTRPGGSPFRGSSASSVRRQMRKIVRSVHHAFSLLRTLDPHRFLIVLLCWTLQRHRRVACLVLNRFRNGCKCNRIAQDPVLIYQMSKVGSTSMFYSLQVAYAKAGLAHVPIHHVHTLCYLEQRARRAAESGCMANNLSLVRKYQGIQRDFATRPDEHWTVISMVRDPIARHISDYFHHLDEHLPDWRPRWREGRLGVDEVMDNFLGVTDHAVEHWFYEEIDNVLGIDVFSAAFPHDIGYALYQRPPKVTLLVIRMEDMNRGAPQAVEQLLGIRNFKLYSFNTAEQQSYRDLYRLFKSQPLPGWYVEKAYTGRLARHFYSDSERENFARKWTGAAAPPSADLVNVR